VKIVGVSHRCGTAGWGTAGRGAPGAAAWGFLGSRHQSNAWEDGPDESWRGRDTESEMNYPNSKSDFQS